MALHTGNSLKVSTPPLVFVRGEQPPDVPEVLFNVVSLEVLFASARLLKKVPGVHAARLFVRRGSEKGKEQLLGSFQGGDFLGTERLLLNEKSFKNLFIAELTEIEF